MTEPVTQPAVANPPSSPFPRQSRSYGSLIAAAAVWGAAIVALLVLTDWQFYVQWLVAGSATTLLFFLLDKIQEKRFRRRIPELVLLALSLAGGVVGAWVGMFLLRHKMKNVLFLVTQVAATALHAVLFWRYVVR